MKYDFDNIKILILSALAILVIAKIGYVSSDYLRAKYQKPPQKEVIYEINIE